jgi:hypothetical protein
LKRGEALQDSASQYQDYQNVEQVRFTDSTTHPKTRVWIRNRYAMPIWVAIGYQDYSQCSHAPPGPPYYSGIWLEGWWQIDPGAEARVHTLPDGPSPYRDVAFYAEADDGSKWDGNSYHAKLSYGILENCAYDAIPPMIDAYMDAAQVTDVANYYINLTA